MASQAEGPGSVIKVGEGHMPRAGGEGKCALLEWQEESMREGPGEGWALGAVGGGGRTGEWHGVAPGSTFGQICIFRSPWSLQGRRSVWKAGPVRKRLLRSTW